MRIFVVQPTADREGHFGAWTVRLCEALANGNHEVTLCTNHVDPVKYLGHPASFTIIEVGGDRLSFDKFDKAFARRRALFYLGYLRNSFVLLRAGLKLARSHDADVIFLTDVEFLIASILLAVSRSSTAVVMELHAANFGFGAYDGSTLARFYKVFQRELFRRAVLSRVSALCVLSKWAGERVRRQLRLPESYPIALVPDATDPPSFVPGRVEARASLGIEFTGPILLFFGIWRRDKGLPQLLEAATRLRGRDFRLVVVGSPRDYQPAVLRDEYLVDQPDSRIIMRAGYVPDADIPNYLCAADAVVFPYVGSYAGGCGPLVKEACAYGRPAIVTDVAGVGTFVAEHKMGVVCEPDSVDALTDALESFLALGDGEVAAMADAARRAAVENSWEAASRKLTVVLEAASNRLVEGLSGFNDGSE